MRTGLLAEAVKVNLLRGGEQASKKTCIFTKRLFMGVGRAQACRTAGSLLGGAHQKIQQVGETYLTLELGISTTTC